MSARSSHIHTARVFLAQSHHYTRRDRNFSFVLLGLAANARRRAMAIKLPMTAQGDLFGGRHVPDR